MPAIPEKLRAYEPRLDDLLASTNGHYDEIKLYIFSDHGMANCDEFVDLQVKVDKLGFEIGVDYAVVYNSTMARFWFLSTHARHAIAGCQSKCNSGWVED